MNILLIHQYFLEKGEPGGSRFNEMVQVWEEEGHTITVIGGMVNYVTGEVNEKYKGRKFHHSNYSENIKVLRCYVSPEYNTSFVGRLWGYFSFVIFGLIGSLWNLRKDKFDVIVVTSPPLFVGIIAYISSVVKGIPYVFEIRDLWPESAVDTGVLKNKLIIKLAYWFEKFIYKHAHKINVLTPAFREVLITKKGILSEKIFFIPNACDFTLSDGLLVSFDRDEFRSLNKWEDKFVITYVGAHGVANHLIQLIDVAEKLQDTNVLFLLIGDGMQKKMLIDKVKERKISNVQFINSMPKKDVMKYIIASNVGTSVLKRVDTFKTIYSNKSFDYMACKKPILLLIDGVSRELIEEAGCGIYAEPENIMDIEMKIRKLLSISEREVIEMGEGGYTFAKRNFDRRELAIKYLQEIKVS